MLIDQNMKLVEFKEKILKDDTPVTKNDEQGEGTFRFYSEQLSIFIPDKTLIDFNISEHNNLSGRTALEAVNIMLAKHDIVEINSLDHIGLATFYILHEIGHYHHYIDEFLNKGIDYNEYLNEYNIQYKEQEERFKRECKLLECELYYVIKQEYYRTMEFEKIADEYAINRIKGNNELLNLF